MFIRYGTRTFSYMNLPIPYLGYFRGNIADIFSNRP